jgi:hypothetical protein
MIHKAKDLSAEQKSVIEALLGCRILEDEAVSVRALDSLSLRLAQAPLDDEPFTEEDRAAVAEADEWSKHNDLIPLEDVLADLGLKMGGWETMSQSPSSEEHNGNG